MPGWSLNVAPQTGFWQIAVAGCSYIFLQIYDDDNDDDDDDDDDEDDDDDDNEEDY